MRFLHFCKDLRKTQGQIAQRMFAFGKSCAKSCCSDSLVQLPIAGSNSQSWQIAGAGLRVHGIWVKTS